MQKSMQGKFPSRCLRTYSHCDLPITGEGGSRVVATTEEPLERSTGEHYCLLMVLVLLAAISLQICCIAVSSGMRGFAKHQNFETGTHMQGEIDHFSQFVCSQCTGPNALVTLVQGGKYTQSLTAQQTVFEVSPVMNMGGNVPLVFCVRNGVWRLGGSIGRQSHREACLRPWPALPMHLLGTRAISCRNPGEGVSLGSVQLVDERCEWASSCGIDPVGGKQRLGRCCMMHTLHSRLSRRQGQFL